MPVQNAESAKALTASLGLKGEVKLQVDPILVPTITTEDLAHSPYSSVIPICGSARNGGVAAEFGFVGIQATPGSILLVDYLSVENETGSAAEYELRALTAADIVTVGAPVTNTSINLNSPLIGGATPRSGALVSRGTHTALVGTVVSRLGVLDGDQGVIKFPYGFASYGNDPVGPLMITLWNTVVNEAIAVNFFGRQFLNKG